MIRYLFVSFLFLLLCSFINQKEAYPPVRNESFSRGEVIHYKMNYGFLSIGKGTAQIHPHYFRLNNRECFKVDISGKTVGMVDWVADLNDQWGAYVDTASLLPMQFYRRIREGRYRKDEWTNFDQINNRIEVKTLDKKTGKLKEPKYYDAAGQVREMISGYLFLRNLNFAKLKVNDTINVPGFFEDEFYNMKILYRGKETIKTKVGKIRTIVLMPVMPDNKIFDGENSIKAWFSDDKNRIPVRIKAELFIGSGEMEIVSYSGLRSKLNLVER